MVAHESIPTTPILSSDKVASKTTVAQRSEWEQRIEEFARCRAHVLQAIYTKPGMTYVEIRLWIHARYRYWMENVGARCRELYMLGYARKETNGNRVYVYPADDEG